ncbi:polysaccharide pyruvyl transferase family protein [Exiguobacterium aurantiacum]|uniref:Polysaccharide pyruvyl transferase family protein n=1 Tax=Exiguobacterium aurantiacum TaxID=33987 RepID=A0ABY5FPI4_9BACL|nr:polysaccharide pyruvyl transferase family protein [Exiguobacterium aurantiacum]UTT43520.1 polysaccharide pyruvyl transferase family protein [Exiguobacterium aurantiacum]
MKVTFISFMGSKNLGDLLIVNQLEKELLGGCSIERYDFNLRKYVSEDNQSQLKYPYIENEKKRKLKQFYNDNLRKKTFLDLLHTLRVKKQIDFNVSNSNFELDIQKSDFILVGGGNAIFDLTPHSDSGYKFKKIIDIAKKYDKKVFVTSIGIGPFQNEKQVQKTREILSQAYKVTLRDEKSYRYIKDISNKPVLSIDPVFLMEENQINDIKVPNEKLTIGICVIDLLLNKVEVGINNKYLNDLQKTIKKLSNDYQIILFSTDYKDYAAVDLVYKQFKNEPNIRKVELKNFEDINELYQTIDFLIGARMHSLIIAAAKGVPFIGLSWQDKVDQMFKMIESTNDVFDINNLEHKNDQLLQRLREKINNLEAEKIKLRNIKINNKLLFKENIRIINDLKASIKV